MPSAQRAPAREEAVARSWLSVLPADCPRVSLNREPGDGWRPKAQVLGGRGTDEGGRSPSKEGRKKRRETETETDRAWEREMERKYGDKDRKVKSTV